jgi:Tfp pilus assembly protein PilO
MFAMLQDLVRDKKKLALAGVVLVVFLYADFSFVIAQQIKGVRSLKQKIGTLRKDIESLNSDIKYVKTTTSKMVTLVTNKKLPLEREIPSVMQNISSIAYANGIRIMQIDSTKETSKAPKKTVVKGKPGGKASVADAVPATSVKIKLEMIANYHKLGNFINEIENAEKLCFVDELSIKRDAADPTKQNVSLVVKTYVKK